MPRLALALLALVTLAACDGTEPPAVVNYTGLDGLSGDPALLAGTWTWERTVACGRGCTETTPATSGTPETLTFTFTPETSSHNGTVVGFFNGTRVGLTRYLLAPAGDGEWRTLDLEENAGFNVFGVSADRLVISAAAADGPETTYRRQR